jgi:tetratricopeptide (TPR) repeat protein
MSLLSVRTENDMLANLMKCSLIWVLVVLHLTGPTVGDLAAQDDCTTRLKEAQRQFLDGEWDASISLIRQCLAFPDLPREQKIKSHDLLAQNLLEKREAGALEQAKASIRALLMIDSTYIPSADSEIGYKQLVTTVRKEMSESRKIDKDALFQRATKFYQQSVLDSASVETRRYLAIGDLTEMEKKSGVELYAQILVRNDSTEAALAQIEKLLSFDPEYMPKADAPEDYRELVEDARRCEFPCTWHYVVGGVIIAGVILYFLLMDDDPKVETDLPAPPEFP